MKEIAEIAYRQRQRVYLTYRSTTHGVTTKRKVDPYGIYYAYNALRLVGFCHLRRDIRQFNFDGRLQNLESLSESFEEPIDFDLNAYADAGFGGVRNQEIVSAVVRVGPPASRWVRHQNFTSLKQKVELEKDYLELHFETDGQEGLLRQVLAWGSSVQVMGDEKFKESYRTEVQKMCKKLTSNVYNKV